MRDTYRHKGLRRKLISELQEKGINDEKVLEAMGKIPRHFFLDSAFLESSYKDRAFPIGEGQTISQPYTVAYQTKLLNVQPKENILEIGTGSGYQACILSELGAKIFTIERNHKLYKKTKLLLQKMKYDQIKIFFGDGYEGLPNHAPFDKILITAATPDIPTKLIEQLKIKGKLIAPVGGKYVQKMVCLTKKSESDYDITEKDSFKFVPLLHGKVW